VLAEVIEKGVVSRVGTGMSVAVALLEVAPMAVALTTVGMTETALPVVLELEAILAGVELVLLG